MSESTQASTIDSYSAFISHSTKDVEVAEEVCAHLEQRGFRCWIAPRNVRPGRNYGEEIVRGIERSKCLILILSDDSNASRPVKDEVECAYRKGKPVFPVRIEEVPPSPALEFFISSSHWIDAWTGDMAQHVERLADGLKGHSADTPFQITGRQIRRRLGTVGLAWPIVMGIAVLGLVLAIWKLGGDGGDHEMPEFDVEEMTRQALESLPGDQARVMQEFDPELITADEIGIRIDAQRGGSGWGVRMEYPTWFYGTFAFRSNVRSLLYSTDGERYAPGPSIQAFVLPATTDSDRLYIKFELRDGTETDPLVYDIDLGDAQMQGAERTLAQHQGPSRCFARFRRPACQVLDGWWQQTMGSLLKSVQVSQDEDFDGEVFEVYVPVETIRNFQYSPPPDAAEYFARIELTNGTKSPVYRVGIEAADWPPWVELDGERQSGERRLDAYGMGNLYGAYEPDQRTPTWIFWGPGFDCRNVTVRYALDDMGLLPADCRSDGLSVRTPGDADMLLIEYELPEIGTAVYRYEVDYLQMASQAMRDGIDKIPSLLQCSGQRGSSPRVRCFWYQDMHWRLPIVERLEFGPTPDDLSGRIAVDLGAETLLQVSSSNYHLINETVVDIEADWRDVFARLVLDDGSVTDVQRMPIRR